MDIRDAANHLALTLATSAIMSLHDAGLLPEVVRKNCAERMREFAVDADGDAIAEGQYPATLVQQVHALSVLLSRDQG